MHGLDEFLDAALEAAGRGWPVHPLNGKRPIWEDWPNKATTDEKRIRATWSNGKSPNVGAVSGLRSGLLIIDVDPRNGGDLDALEKEWGKLPKTLTVKSGRGEGGHLYFKLPETWEPKKPKVEIAPGIDLLVGQNFVLPPSVHPDTGEPYTWKDPAVPIAQLPFRWQKELRPLFRFRVPERTILNERNDIFTSYAAQLKADEKDEEEILATLEKLNDETDPPFDDEKLRTLAKWAQGKEAVTKTSTSFNVVAKILKAADEAGIELWRSENDEPWATASQGTHRENWPVESRQFRRWLAGVYLRYDDLGLKEGPFGKIRWPGETDKEGKEWVSPLHPEARKVVDAIMADRPGVRRGYLFPSPSKPTEPIWRHLAKDWLLRAEDLAELDHLPQGGYHSFRRAWATMRKHLPELDVAQAGGWKTIDTLKTAYQDTDNATLIDVVMGGKELREAK